MNATEWFTLVNGLVKTSDYGPRQYRLGGRLVKDFHYGIDYGGKNVRGKQILCPKGGIVTNSGWDPLGYGYYIGVTIDTGHVLGFAHLDSRDVAKGSRIRRGGSVGKLGSTGKSTAPHLHFFINKLGGGVKEKNCWGNPDDFNFGEDEEMRKHCVVGFKEVDTPTLMPIVKILRKQDDCPIYYRDTMTKTLAMYQTVHVVGGGEDFLKEIKELAPEAKIVPITGPTRLETAVAAWDWWSKNK